jgi:hypothetical protein
MIGLRKLYAGDFNYMAQDWQPDGSVIVTLGKRGQHVKYRMHVRTLYGEHEQVLEHEVVPIRTPQWVIDRMEEAKKHGPEDNL